MIFISNLSKILDEKFHISQTTPVWESKFFTYKRDTKEIFSIKKLAYKSTWNNIRNSALQKNFVAGSIPVMRKNASCFAPQGTNLNFRKNCILVLAIPFNDDPVQKTIKLSRTKEEQKNCAMFFSCFFFLFFLFFFQCYFSFSSNAQTFSPVFLHFFCFFAVFPAFKSVFNSSGQK